MKKLPKIVILDGYTENPGDLSWDGFSRLGELTVHERTTYNAEDTESILAAAKGAEILILNKTPLNAKTLDALAPELRYVGVLATGYNVVDVSHARENGVTVCNIPAYGTAAVAQMTIALLLELCHHIGEHSRSVYNGDWSKSVDFCYWNYPLIELSGKTLGIIGYGRIGRNVAEIAVTLGMNVLAYDEHTNPQLETDKIKYADLDTLFRKSDVISLHCPLFPATAGIICKENLAKMSDHTLLINTSRGGLIIEQDLTDALNSGKIAGAALDVVSVEPIQSDNPLLSAKNCILTPHIAWAPKESRQRLMDIALSNLVSYLDGNSQNVV